jgi:hypothetical protein
MKVSTMWVRADRADRDCVKIADRHYNRQKIGSPQFVPPGRCLVLRGINGTALWTTSWPFAEYVRHEWAGAWVNSLFRRESGERASDMIRDAVAITRSVWQAPELGMVTFVDPRKVPAVVRRGESIYGYCYLKAGFNHIGFTKGGLWAWQLLPHEMPEPIRCQRQEFMAQHELFAVASGQA